MKGKSKVTLRLFTCLLFSLTLIWVNSGTLAKEVKEHPLIRPFPASVLAINMSKNDNFSEYEFYYIDDKTQKRNKKKVKGEYYYLLYEVRTPSGERVKDISKLEFYENYRAAAEEKGGKVVYEDQGQMVFTVPREDGGRTWCRVSTTNLGQQYLVIVDEKGFEKSLTFGPKELKDALDRDGRVLLYGILFDLDKACLKPESVKQLQHVVTLLITHGGLKLEVQGHTDNQGAEEYNLDLSKKRAQTVCTYLTLFGVSPDRLRAAGYGETRPVESNDTEEGRAKNRRVELVKMDASAPGSEKSADTRTSRQAGIENTPEKAASTVEALQGTWEMAASKRVKEGRMTFYADGTYLMEERFHDGTGVSKKGEFRVDEQASPHRMDICLEKCGRPGSEFTTGFCIFRFLPEGKLEIRSSPHAEYPDRFQEEQSDEYTMVLNKIKMK
jgi:outer membrane protein OmpA-like peptidoglycan-associated protein